MCILCKKVEEEVNNLFISREYILQVWQDLSMALTSWVSGRPMPEEKPLAIKSEAMVAEHAAYFFKTLSKIRQIYSGNIIVMHLDGRYTKPELISGFEDAGKKIQ